MALTPRAAALAQQVLADPAGVRAKIIAERARRSGSNSFAAFVKQAWQYVPQVEPLEWGWHLDAVTAHLEEVARGFIPRCAINIAPGTGKSVVMSVLWPAWIWTWWPRCQFLFASYSHSFAVRDAGRCRDVIGSDWYKENYSARARWELRSDQNAKDNFANSLGGVRLSTSTDGSGAGLRAHVIGIDDPLNIRDAYSKAARDAANEFIGKTLSQRFVDARRPRVAMIMQRLHMEDPTGFVLNGGLTQVAGAPALESGWEHLMLPSEFEPDRKSRTHHFVEQPDGTRARTFFWEDPRQEPGELLFPTRHTKEVLESFKLPNALGSDGYAGQHMQRPSPAGGGMFKVDAWRFWRFADDPDVSQMRPKIEGVELSKLPAKVLSLEDIQEQLISMDATFKKTQKGSYVAIHVWGRLGARRILLERVHARMDFTESVAALRSVIRRWPLARRKLIEGKANGDAIIATLGKEHVSVVDGKVVVEPPITGIEAVNPGSDSKEQRANAMQPYQAAGNVELYDGAPYIGEYIGEHAAFPNGPWNDDVDAQAQGLQGLEHERTPADKYNDIEWE